MNTKQNPRLAYLLPLRCVLFALLFATGAAVTGRKLEEISHWWSIAASIVNLLVIFLLFRIAKRQNSSYRELIRYKAGKTTAKQTVGISLLVLVVGMAGMYLAGLLCYGKLPYAPPMLIAPVPAWMAAVNVVLLPVTTALAEEGLYLGCGVNQIRRPLPAVVIPAFFFALQHSFIPTLPDWRYMIYRFLSFLPLTLILCGYYYRKRNPLPIMAGHAIIDAATGLQILATSTIPGLYDMMCAM